MLDSDMLSTSGTGSIAEIQVKLVQGNGESIHFAPNNIFIDPLNNEIPVIETIGGVVINP